MRPPSFRYPTILLVLCLVLAAVCSYTASEHWLADWALLVVIYGLCMGLFVLGSFLGYLVDHNRLGRNGWILWMAVYSIAVCSVSFRLLWIIAANQHHPTAEAP